MSRPVQPRRVGGHFRGRGLKPVGVPARDLPVVALALDEVEALRLADLEGLYHEAAAEQMGISRPTFARIVARARRAVADALVNQKLLLVTPGPVVEVERRPLDCPVHWGGRRRGRGCRCGATDAS
jgi:predicted DNA-binding protein (UPF0251 family)